MSNVGTEVKDFALDLLKRAASTAWQSGLALAIVLWGGSGLHIHDLLTISGLGKAWSVVCVAALGAAASAFKTAVVTYLAAHRAEGEKVGKDVVKALVDKFGVDGVLKLLESDAQEVVATPVAGPAPVVAPVLVDPPVDPVGPPAVPDVPVEPPAPQPVDGETSGSDTPAG